MNTIDTDADEIVSEAQNQSRNELLSIIIEKTETYIVNKAATYDAEITVSVSISEPDTLLPDTMSIEGEVSPYIKEILQNVIAEDLGIPKEKQIWN